MTPKIHSASLKIPAATALAAILLVSCAGPSPSPTGARISEKRETIRTYQFGDPDPVPIFARSSMWGQGEKLYPYFFFDNFGSTAADKDWTVVRLKNRFIEVAVLPEVGGKVWGASDLSTGRDFLYWNHVLKFRQIAMRGPWTSGGIEFNFGVVGHAPSTATPVDYIVKNNPDGSVSLVVGNLDLPSRTRWSQTITVRPDSPAFETRGAWRNSTPYNQSYYYWSCAAAKAADDLKYVFPADWFIGHDYSVPLETWPVDQTGRDLSWYKNNDIPDSKSYFCVGRPSEFYGGWYKNSDAGFGHWSRYEDMPGKKVWIWDLSRSGGIWVDLLTDKDGQYTEPQAGRLLNQSDHGDFPSGLTDGWRELWFPYDGIGPMAGASSRAVLGLDAGGSGLRLGLYALQNVHDELVVVSGGRTVFSEALDLEPAGKWRKDVPGIAPTAAFEVRLGKEMLYRSAPGDDEKLDRPFAFRNISGAAVEETFLRARRMENERNFGQALEEYQKCLKLEPDHLRALVRTAELFLRRGETERGRGFARRALELSMYDPEANYVYGLASRTLGRNADARVAFGWASRSPLLRTPALCRMAGLAMAEGDFDRAVELAGKAVDSDGANSQALETFAAALRLAGQKAEAVKVLDRLLDADPLDHMARFEKYLISRKQADLDSFRSLIRNELPYQTYLEIAMFYIGNGLKADAVTLLEIAPRHAEVLYWLAYLLRDSVSAKSAAYLDEASAASPAFVLPYREEDIPLFEWVAERKAGDWKPKYYLGLIYWSKGRHNEALDRLKECGQPDFWPFYISRAILLESRNAAAAAADYRKAIQTGPDAWRTHHTLAGFLLRTGRNEEALAAARVGHNAFPESGPIQVDLIKALQACGDHKEAETIMDGLTVLPYEGATEVHGLYVKSELALAFEDMKASRFKEAVARFEKSKEFPERLGTGEPFHPDFRLQDYFEAACYQRSGDNAAAEAKLKSVADYSERYINENGPYSWFGGLVLRHAGRNEEARKLLAGPKLEPGIMEMAGKFSAVR